MSDAKKVWVIDDGKGPELTSLGEPFEASARPAPRPRPARPAARRTAADAVPAAARAAARPHAVPRRTMQPAMLLILAYALGPAGLLLTRAGRRATPWVAAAAVWAVLAAAVGLGWRAVVAGSVGVDVVPWLAVGTLVALAAGFTLWARSVDQAAVAAAAITPPGPWTALLLGLAAPGSAQVLARCPGRGVLTLWAAWPFVAAVAAAAAAPLLWSHRAVFAPWGLPAADLERVLVAAAVAAAAAPLLWLAQALEGARLLAGRTGRWRGARGDWTVVALAASLGVAVVVADPGNLAAGLGEYADALEARDCTVAPLLLVRTAQRLDPAQPAHALHAARLYAAVGAEDRARAVRAELDRNLQPYLGALMRERRGTARPQAAPAVAPASALPLPGAPLLPDREPVRRPSGPPRPESGPRRHAGP